ncbi:lysophospholipid acyltransferase family protein [Salinispirillum sp. LH 10-3-1]|uniref:Lysophospholipid acyltransferase family protein n=1 Tax=Salinispirillum sp. LH 10-3-1 TaxID=2952525 RepID=A0AB38YBQ1_9GAMM
MSLPESQLPRRGNAFSSLLGRLILSLFGWKVTGQLPNVSKAILIGGPHTSNWDGVVTLSAMAMLRLDARVMVKDSAFVGPLGLLLRWLGAMPIDRNSARDVVQQTVDQLNAHAQFMVIVSPEGTRDGASQWKSGFWRIASAAGVPIVVATADYKKKEVSFPGLVMPSEDMDADMKQVLEFYRGVEPRHTERLSAPLAAMRNEPREKHDTQ